MSAGPIELTDRVHAALFFDVLAEVDLGRDVANLYQRRWQTPPWARELTAHLRGRPEAAQIQALPLVTEDLDELCAGLERLSAQGALASPLTTLLIDVLRGQADAFQRIWAIGRPARDHRRRHLEGRFLDDLRALRQALYSTPLNDEVLQHATPATQPVVRGLPRLVVLDVPALARRARATTGPGGERVVAASLADPETHLLPQLFHEDVRAVTDPAVRARFEGEAGTPPTDDPTFALHRALEEAAVARGDDVVAETLPSALPAYRGWRASVGMPFTPRR